jgi:hypothetical protein
MSILPFRDKTCRVKSSRALRKYLDENRELNRKFESKLLTLFTSHGDSSFKSSFGPPISNSYKKTTDNSSEGSSSTRRNLKNQPVEESLTISIRSNHSAQPKFPSRLKIRTKISKNWFTSKSKQATPDYFKKALHSILKEPLDRPFLKKRHVPKPNPL